MPSQAALKTAGALDATRRAARLARDLNAAVAHVRSHLDADFIASIDLPQAPGHQELDEALHLLAEAAQTGPVVLTITRPSNATMAP